MDEFEISQAAYDECVKAANVGRMNALAKGGLSASHPCDMENGAEILHVSQRQPSDPTPVAPRSERTQRHAHIPMGR